MSRRDTTPFMCLPRVRPVEDIWRVQCICGHNSSAESERAARAGADDHIAVCAMVATFRGIGKEPDR